MESYSGHLHNMPNDSMSPLTGYNPYGQSPHPQQMALAAQAAAHSATTLNPYQLNALLAARNVYPANLATPATLATATNGGYPANSILAAAQSVNNGANNQYNPLAQFAASMPMPAHAVKVEELQQQQVAPAETTGSSSKKAVKTEQPVKYGIGAPSLSSDTLEMLAPQQRGRRKGSGKDAQPLPKELRSQKHNEAEVRRRMRLNQLLSDLAAVVGCTEQHKSSVLRVAIQHVQECHRKILYYEEQIRSRQTNIELLPPTPGIDAQVQPSPLVNLLPSVTKREPKAKHSGNVSDDDKSEFTSPYQVNTTLGSTARTNNYNSPQSLTHNNKTMNGITSDPTTSAFGPPQHATMTDLLYNQLAELNQPMHNTQPDYNTDYADSNHTAVNAPTPTPSRPTQEIYQQIVNDGLASLPLVTDILNKLQNNEPLNANENNLLTFLSNMPMPADDGMQASNGPQLSDANYSQQQYHSSTADALTTNNNDQQPRDIPVTEGHSTLRVPTPTGATMPSSVSASSLDNTLATSASASDAENRANKRKRTIITPSPSVYNGVTSPQDSCTAVDHALLFHNSATAMDILTLDGTIVDCNEPFAQFFGLNRSTMLRRSIFDLTHPQHIDITLQHRQRLLEGNVAVTNKVFSTATGRSRAARVTSWLTHHDGKPKYVNTVLEPISD